MRTPLGFAFLGTDAPAVTGSSRDAPANAAATIAQRPRNPPRRPAARDLVRPTLRPCSASISMHSSLRSGPPPASGPRLEGGERLSLRREAMPLSTAAQNRPRATASQRAGVRQLMACGSNVRRIVCEGSQPMFGRILGFRRSIHNMHRRLYRRRQRPYEASYGHDQ